VVSASTNRPGIVRRAFFLAVLALVLSALAAAIASRLRDDLPGAWWIGHFPRARLGEPATVAFATRFDVGAATPTATLRLRADRSYEAFFDGIGIGSGGAAGAPVLEEWTLTGPIAAGEHDLLVRVAHPEGVCALRLALSFPGTGRREVVTGPGWRVDDDERRMKTGFGGLRYPATLWARPPLSVFSVSSSRRSSRGSTDVSTAPASSRIPSRAATE